MSAQETLNAHGISMQQAHDWVLSKIDQPREIFDTAKAFGITNAMLAEIVSLSLPHVNATDVENFFNFHGLNGSDLRETPESADNVHELPSSTVIHGEVLAGQNNIWEIKDSIFVQLETGKTYFFDVRGASTGEGSMQDPWVALSVPSGLPIALDDNSGVGFNARIVHEIGSKWYPEGNLADGTIVEYTVEIMGMGHPGGGSYTFEYGILG